MLHLRKLSLTNLATHDATDLSFPERGVVVLTGSNGAGKSALMEAVATALWGESLRGELPWRAGVAGSATIETDGLTATRKRSKAGSAKLEWVSGADEPVAYETTSKAQAALEHLIGSYDVWRRTCVLSSVDSAAFSLARDSDRKRLLEEFLGLSLFDTALEACRKDKKEAAAKAAAAERARTEVNLKFGFAQTQLDQLRKELESLPPAANLESMRADGKDLAARVDALKAQIREAEVRRIAVIKEQANVTASLRAEGERLSRLKDDTCITCGQNVVDVRSHLREEVRRLKSQINVSLASLEIDLTALNDLIPRMNEEHHKLSTELGNFRTEFRMAEHAARQRAGLAQKVMDAQNTLSEWQAKVKDMGDTSNAAELEMAHMDAVEQVLGLRGVRAQVLDHSLKALEQQANAWLDRMPTEQGPLQISLTGSTTQKSGSVVDSISLKVHGRPYASCSGGERRRVDVALLLALRELAVAAHGRDGSLLCDEVFDALDAQGQTDVAAALGEMAQDRMVLVVTHSPELAKALRPKAKIHVGLVEGVAKVTTS